MILAELYTIVGSRTGLSADDSGQKTIMLNAANGQLKRLYTKFNLEAEKDAGELTTISGTDAIIVSDFSLVAD